MTTATTRTLAETRADESRVLRLAIGASHADAELTLPTSAEGAWTNVLGRFELPADDALDRLAEHAATWTSDPGSAPTHIEIYGAPAAALLPIAWLRTIWLGPEVPVTLHWERVEPCGADPREALAARLCAGVVQRIECPDAEGASRHFGIEVGPQRPIGLSAFDLLTGMIDSWEIEKRIGHVTDPGEWRSRMRAAMESLRERGVKRIAIYGAGRHTRALASLFEEPSVEIACIVDDDPNRHGSRLWGFEISSRERAMELGVEGVILSSNCFEEKLWAAAQPFRDAGLPVLRLYAQEAEQDVPFGSAARR